MADTAPETQPQSSQPQYPNLNPNGTANAILNNAQSAMSSIANSQTVQSLQNGPMADKARSEVNQTKNEFSNLASSRQTPKNTTASGQELTHYHSFFYNLLSWENPRVTSLSYAAIVTFIFATRYVPLVRYALRLTWITLGVTAAAELTGQLVLGQGVVSKMRPRKYYTIPRQSLEAALEDVEQLINFFVIEVQRIIFAENVTTTIAAFATALLTYFLIKIMPSWGLALFFTTLVYFVPLGYISNKELIDGHLENASQMISAQTSQVRDLASQHTSKAVEMSQSAFKDYSSKAQEMMGSAKKTAVEKNYVSQETADKVTPAAASEPAPKINSDAFPAAPKQEPIVVEPEVAKEEPIPAQ